MWIFSFGTLIYLIKSSCQIEHPTLFGYNFQSQQGFGSTCTGAKTNFGELTIGTKLWHLWMGHALYLTIWTKQSNQWGCIHSCSTSL
jgi:hypothetical protein